jgi:hypothetical protein
MLFRLKFTFIRFHNTLGFTKTESLSVYPAFLGVILLAIQVIGTWLFGLGTLYVGIYGFILLSIGSLIANILKETS